MVYNAIRIAVPIILILVGMFDMGRAITLQKEDEIKKAQQLLVRKAVAAAIVFIIVSARAQECLGGKIDFVLHAVAQSMNLRRHKDYEEANYNYYTQTMDISAMSLHKILRVALEEDAIAEGGSVVALSYIASERYCHGYNDTADAKALLESIARQFGAIYGSKKGVRVNIVSQSPTPTKAGGKWAELDYWYRYTDMLSPLGNASADDCANVCVALFSDLMRSVTMQVVYNDGGFGRTILTEKVIDELRNKI